MKTKFYMTIICLAMFSSFAYADKGQSGNENAEQSLVLRMNMLQQKIEQLESEMARLKAIQQTFTTLMPEFSERFHVMHLAGEAGDWAVAAHEVLEMQRMIKISKVIDPNKGKLMEAFIGRNLDQLRESIEHANIKSFF